MWFTKSSNRFDFEHYHEPAVENLPGIPLNFSHFDQSRALWRARSPLPEPSVASWISVDRLAILQTPPHLSVDGVAQGLRVYAVQPLDLVAQRFDVD